MAMIVYRGVLQRSRLRLLLDAFPTDDHARRFTWLHTVPVERRQRDGLEELLGQLHTPVSLRILDGRRPAWRATRAGVAALLRTAPDEDLYVIGPSALAYVPLDRRPLVLCANGIPEERELHRDGLAPRVASRLAWLSHRAALAPRRRAAVVVVSSRMADLVRSRLGVHDVFVAPTAAGEEYFQQPLDRPRPFAYCYQGSGAPWQGLERLNQVWRALAAAEPDARFLVVSRDDRCRALGEGMPAGTVEFASAADPGAVATLLAQCQVGFVLRHDHVVNRVSYPTKVGESLACGLALVMTELDWDPAEVLREHGKVGALVAPDAPATVVAHAASELRSAHSTTIADACREAALPLRRSALQGELREQVRRWWAAR